MNPESIANRLFKHAWLGFALAVGLSLTGCFSMNHGTVVGSTKTKEEALVKDIVTAPVQAVLLPTIYVGAKLEQAGEGLRATRDQPVPAPRP